MKKILIVVDMQNDFITGALGTNEAKQIVNNVVDKVTNWNGLIYFTRDTHFSNYDTTLEGKYLPIEHCLIDTYGWSIIDELNDYACNRTADKKCKSIIDKYTFGYDRWNQHFTGVEKLEFELCGVCTDICVISNALILRALYPNSKITVDASCCAGTTVENHEAALRVMQSCQIDIVR